MKYLYILFFLFIFNLNLFCMEDGCFEQNSETQDCIVYNLAWTNKHDINYIFEYDHRVKLSHICLPDRLFASNNQLVVIDLETKKLKFIVDIPNLICARFSSDNETIIVISGSNYITILDRQSGKIKNEFCLCDLNKLDAYLKSYPDLIKFSVISEFVEKNKLSHE